MKNTTSIILLIFVAIQYLTGCKTVREKQKPNILFAIADDASWKHFGAYGCDWVKTPAFDRVASEGILFTRCYTPNAKCAPSRACILTGRNSWELEEAANHMPFFPEKFKTVTETLHENGYHVGYTGKGWVPGVSRHKDGSPRDLLVKKYDRNMIDPPAEGIASDDYSSNFRDFLESKQEGQPFFFWYGGWEPHRPYEFGSGTGKGMRRKDDITEVPLFWPDVDSVRTDMLDYAFELEYFDSQLGKMLEILEASGEYENTVIIVTADNGMPFPRVKGQVYEMSNHLPLAIMWNAGIKRKNRVVSDLLSFTDFAPTILELARIPEEQTEMATISGKSLTGLLFSSKSGNIDPARDYVLIGKERHDVGRPGDAGYPVRGIVMDDFLYLKNFEVSRWPAGNPETGYLNCDGSPTKTVCIGTQSTGSNRILEMNFGKRPGEELYHIGNDPYCILNLAGNPKYEEVQKKLSERMIRELIQQGDPRVLGNGDVFDSYKICFENLRDYYHRYTSGEKIEAGWVNVSDYQPAWPDE